MKKLFISTLLILSFTNILADWVYDSKSKESFKILETDFGAKIYFTLGYGPDFIIKISGSIYSADAILILKDDFCSYESNVLNINGEVFDIDSVTKIDQVWADSL